MFETIAGVLLVGAVVVAFLAYRRSQTSRPVFEVRDDDAEMIGARQKAQDALEELKRAHSAGYPEVGVKLPVTSSTGTVEFMVGDVIELTGVYVKVQFRGRPVTHSGAFDAIQSFSVRDIADWFVTLPNGKIRGGFTMRVHFDRLRRWQTGRNHERRSGEVRVASSCTSPSSRSRASTNSTPSSR